MRCVENACYVKTTNTHAIRNFRNISFLYFYLRNVGLDDAQHVDRGLVELDEDAVVDLQEAEELEDLAHLGRDAVDTADADDEGKLVLGRHVEVAGLASLWEEEKEGERIGVGVSKKVGGDNGDNVGDFA